MSKTPATILGTGLTAVQFALTVAASVALFAFWNGPLWSAPADASHVQRFAVSYLAVPPLVFAVLLAVRRFNWTRWLTALGLVWAVKLGITWLMYTILAGGTATTYQPATTEPHAESDAAPVAEGYHAASGVFESGSIRGTVVRDGAPVAGALVALDEPAPGADLPHERAVDMEIHDGHYARPLYWVTVADTLTVSNHDTALYTVHLFSGAGSVANHPVPAGSDHLAVTLPEPGLYRVKSDGAVDAETHLLVVDHPYVATTGDDGAFSFDVVPLGESRVFAVGIDGDQLMRAESTVQVSPGAPNPIELTLTRK